MDRETPLYGVELAKLKNLTGEPRSQRRLHFRLMSDAFPTRQSALDLYIPAFHRYDSPDPSHETNCHFARYLDVISTWKNLSTCQARELEFWEEMFAAVLEYLISNRVMEIIDNMDKYIGGRHDTSLDLRICDFVNSLGSKSFPVNIQDVINGMLELYKRHGMQHCWFSSSGDLHNTLCDFLRTRDCFQDTPIHPTIMVHLSAVRNAKGEPAITGTVKWRGPSMKFDHLQAFATEGSDYHVIPRYTEPLLDSRYHSHLTRPEYYLASDCINFSWQQPIEGFQGCVPSPTSEATTPTHDHHQHARIHQTPLDIASVASRLFPGIVRYERQLRVQIQLVIHRAHTTTTPKTAMSVASGHRQPQKPEPLTPCSRPSPLIESQKPSSSPQRYAHSKPWNALSQVQDTELLSKVATASPFDSLLHLEHYNWPNPPDSHKGQVKSGMPSSLSDLSHLMRGNKRATKSPAVKDTISNKLVSTESADEILSSAPQKADIESCALDYTSKFWGEPLLNTESTNIGVHALAGVVRSPDPVARSPQECSPSTVRSFQGTCSDSVIRLGASSRDKSRTQLTEVPRTSFWANWQPDQTKNTSLLTENRSSGSTHLTQHAGWGKNVPAWSNWWDTPVPLDRFKPPSDSLSQRSTPADTCNEEMDHVVQPSVQRSWGSSSPEAPLEMKSSHFGDKGKHRAEDRLINSPTSRKPVCRNFDMACGQRSDVVAACLTPTKPPSDQLTDTSFRKPWDLFNFDSPETPSSSLGVSALRTVSSILNRSRSPYADIVPRIDSVVSSPGSGLSDTEFITRIKREDGHGLQEHGCSLTYSRAAKQQADIKEWHDAMCLKKGVVNLHGNSVRQTTDERGDEEAYEKAFLWEETEWANEKGVCKEKEEASYGSECHRVDHK